jgi:hypothetical protein
MKPITVSPPLKTLLPDTKGQLKYWKALQATLLPQVKDKSNENLFATFQSIHNAPISVQTHLLVPDDRRRASAVATAMAERNDEPQMEIITSTLAECKGRRIDPMSFRSIDRSKAKAIATVVFNNTSAASTVAQALREVITARALQHAITVETTEGGDEYVTMRFNTTEDEVRLGTVEEDMRTLLGSKGLDGIDYILPYQKDPMRYIEVMIPRHKHSTFVKASIFTSVNRHLRVKMDQQKLCYGCGALCFGKRCAECNKKAADVRAGQVTMDQLKSFCQYCNQLHTGEHYKTCAKRADPEPCLVCKVKGHTSFRCSKLAGVWLPYEQSPLVPRQTIASPTRTKEVSPTNSYVSIASLLSNRSTPVSILKNSNDSAVQSPRGSTRSVSFSDSPGPSASQTAVAINESAAFNIIMEAVDKRIAASTEALTARFESRFESLLQQQRTQLAAMEAKRELAEAKRDEEMQDIKAMLRSLIGTGDSVQSNKRSATAAQLASPVKASRTTAATSTVNDALTSTPIKKSSIKSSTQSTLTNESFTTNTKR